MTKRGEIFTCAICGNMVEMVRGGAGTLVCCGQPMIRQDENTQDAATEKHVPVIEKIDGGIKVTVGSVLHPMEENHYIEWIQVTADGKSCTEYLKPGEPPVATFRIDTEEFVVREFCNLHGVWKA